jgi:hypothetical protein
VCGTTRETSCRGVCCARFFRFFKAYIIISFRPPLCMALALRIGSRKATCLECPHRDLCNGNGWTMNTTLLPDTDVQASALLHRTHRTYTVEPTRRTRTRRHTRTGARRRWSYSYTPTHAFDWPYFTGDTPLFHGWYWSTASSCELELT